jgi:hypothetical protein
MHEIVDAILHVIGHLPDMVPPALGRGVEPVHELHLVKERFHGAELVPEEGGLLPHPRELLVLVAEQFGELAEERVHHPGRRTRSHPDCMLPVERIVLLAEQLGELARLIKDSQLPPLPFPVKPPRNHRERVRGAASGGSGAT